MTYALKALALTLILSILLTGALAVHMTSVYLVVSFGTPPEISAPSVPLVDMASLAPLPLRKPSLKK